MTLGDIIKAYRLEQNISQRQFATNCGVSNGYISMLEKNENPKTGLPMVPSLLAIKKIADAMNVSAHDLLLKIDDMDIGILTPAEEENEIPAAEIDSGYQKLFTELFALLPTEKKDAILAQITKILSEQ